MAAVAGAVTRVERVLAAGDDGQTVVVGGKYDDVRSTTRFMNVTDGSPILKFGQFDPNAQPPIVDPQHAEEIRITGGARPVIELERLPESQRDRGARTTISPDRVITPWVDAHRGDFRVHGSHFSIALRAMGRSVGAEGHAQRVGVRGSAPKGAGIVGTGFRGGTFTGTKAQERLKPDGRSTHPTRGLRRDLFVDKDGRLWYCRGGTQWTQLA